MVEEKKALTKKCNKVLKVEFFCREDAEAAANKLSEETCTYYELSTRIEEKAIYGKGRPRNEGAREIKEMRYLVLADISETCLSGSLRYCGQDNLRALPESE